MPQPGEIETPEGREPVFYAGDGGPAFPAETSTRNYAGMSLRDWFAGQALAGWLATFGADDGSPVPCHIARFAYGVADAMLVARAEGR